MMNVQARKRTNENVNEKWTFSNIQKVNVLVNAFLHQSWLTIYFHWFYRQKTNEFSSTDDRWHSFEYLLFFLQSLFFSSAAINCWIQRIQPINIDVIRHRYHPFKETIITNKSKNVCVRCLFIRDRLYLMLSFLLRESLISKTTWIQPRWVSTTR